MGLKDFSFDLGEVESAVVSHKVNYRVELLVDEARVV